MRTVPQDSQALDSLLVSGAPQLGQWAEEMEGAAFRRGEARGMVDEMQEANSLTIAGFQKHISERYEKVDRERGTAKTFMFFAEEFGELATALAHGNDRANIEEEFADVFAWLCTLANINDVDIAAAVARKYLGNKRPEGHK